MVASPGTSSDAVGCRAASRGLSLFFGGPLGSTFGGEGFRVSGLGQFGV